MADAATKAAYVETFGTDKGWLGIEGSYFIEGYRARKNAFWGVELPRAVQPTNPDDALLIDNLLRASLSRDSYAIDAARMALRQRFNDLRSKDDRK